MKNRSHRLSTSDHHDDWVDGSWTVDCVCGVNFDDGEEMVNCDECGVWVHTRCSRYVKSEKLFACDKCKNNTTTTTTTRNDSEETEVAQLLVELPTKTLRMDNPYPPYGPPRRLWADIPIAERVHVQGIPGGDPALFGGLSSVFTPELWKCTGYVPKKFNFQYTEFPCWDGRQEVDATKMEEDPVDNGAGVLFSLSMENVPATPMANLVGMKTRVEESGHDRVAPSKDSNKSDVEDLDATRCQSGVKKDRSLLRPPAMHSSKRKKDGLGTSKDRIGKKARVVEKDGESKKKAHASRTASTLSSDAKQLDFNEDRGPKVIKNDTQRTENGNERAGVPGDHLGDGYHAVDSNIDKVKNNLASSDQISEVLSSDVFRHGISVGTRPKEDMVVHHISSGFESSSKTDDGVSLLENNDSGSVPIKEEVCLALDKSEEGGGSSKSVGVDSYKLESLVEGLATAEAEAEDNRNIQDSNGDMTPSSLQPHVHIKSKMDSCTSGGAFDNDSSPPTDVKVNEMRPSARHLGISASQVFEKIEVSDEAVTNSQSSEPTLQDVERRTEAVSNSPTDKAHELPGPCKLKRQLADLEGSMAVRKTPSEPKHSLRPAEEPSKSGGLAFGPPAPPSQRKVIVSIGKSCSTMATAISKPSISDNCRPANFPIHNLAAKRGISDSNFSSKRDNTSLDIVRDDDGREMPKKIPKEHPKSCLLKMSHSTKTLNASVSKRTSSDSKDPVPFSSSKASSAQNVALTSSYGESGSSTLAQSASHAQTKITVSGLPQKGEKVNQLSSQPSSKVNNSPTMHPPATLNSAAALSDEELALLLHQELNSSPRVPRVPRMRHAGSLPQLASPTASSMLMKRTSSSGGKDHSSISRRKSRDLAKDGSHSRELENEAKKIDMVTSSPDRRKHDLMCTTGPTRKREVENGIGKGVHPVKKCIPPAPTGAAISGLSSTTDANEQNLSSTRNSPRNASDDDTGTIRRPAHITLPGLIDEIMSKGKRMTYEELCNAVLPHWPNLRKHNGERYAYSSHLQAVLDCLRNRHEWASLIDRGPKTNASRKRRKLDDELPSFESEDNEYAEDRNGKEVEHKKSLESQREEFPKGKRKARKRRRLALQGRGIKDFRRRRKEAMLSDGDNDDDDDDDVASFSSSSEEESMFSGEDDEIEGGGGTCPVPGEASASSDEIGTMQ